MAKMADAGEDHRQITLVGGGNDFLITYGAARLNRARRSRIGRSLLTKRSDETISGMMAGWGGSVRHPTKFERTQTA